MLEGFIGGLIVAWLLSLFGVDHMVLEVCQTFTEVQLTTSFYYIGFALIGLIGGAFKK
ncbi:hypothetical protein [Niameybacter massiliensis]|uniref:hypothetical protein n=1 Tax=Niameybacter massiliensis TaxID=1658108 RepID=UPI0012B60C56|nr:hypothetical protein [Niameybacter massiliensis]